MEGELADTLRYKLSGIASLTSLNVGDLVYAPPPLQSNISFFKVVSDNNIPIPKRLQFLNLRLFFLLFYQISP